MRPVIYLVVLPLAVLIAVLHTVAIENYFYWKFFWFDMIVHVSAGALAGTLSYLLARQYAPQTKAALWGILGALVVGGMWEFFEFVNGVSQYEAGFWFDTGKDLAMDVLGGAVAALLAAYRNV